MLPKEAEVMNEQKMHSSVTLKRGKEESIRRRHPWIFSGAVERAGGTPNAGDTVEILDVHGNLLAKGAYSPKSQIRARVWSFNPDDIIDADFFRRRLTDALELRRKFFATESGNAFRIINAESDGLPGVVIDLYDKWLVGQFLSAGAERWKRTIADAAIELTGALGFYERSDSDARSKEGLGVTVGMIAGNEPPSQVEIDEEGIRYLIDIRQGHKTGFYLDQRENRSIVRRHAAEARVLNVFSYTGGFGLAAAAGGAASVCHVDASADALALAKQNAVTNGYNGELFEYIQGDAFQILRGYRTEERTFDLIVLDPPKFASNAAQVERAARGYKDINLTAMQLLRPGGLLFTFSCSGHVTPDLFQKIVAGAAIDSGRDISILQFLSQSADHPVALTFPEGHYLKGLVCRVAG